MNLKSVKHSWSFFSTKEAYSSILDKSFSAPTAEGRFLDHGFTKEEIPYIYMLPFKILKEPKLIMFQVKIIHNILPTQSSLFRARITDTDVCPLCNLESQSLKHMLITCSVSSSFWTFFSNWLHEKFNRKLTLSESTMFLLQAYATVSWTLTVFCCVSTTKLIFFAP